MTRLIDADALRDALQYEIDKVTPPFDDTVGAVRCGIRLARNIAEDQPTVDAVPVVHGRWELVKLWTGFESLYCSKCNHETNMASNYCPFCGARMDGNETES